MEHTREVAINDLVNDMKASVKAVKYSRTYWQLRCRRNLNEMDPINFYVNQV